MKYLLFLSFIGCTMANQFDQKITELFDCFSLKAKLGVGAISNDQLKNLSYLKKGDLAPLSESEAANFIDLYPDAVNLCDYYPIAAFLSEENELAVLLFDEYYAAEDQSNFIIQTLYKNKPVANINLSDAFENFSIEDFSDNKVTIADGFSDDFFMISIFEKPAGQDAEFGEIYIDTKGNIKLEGGSGMP